MAETIIKLKKLHAKQQEIVTTSRRFNVLKCGRRFGKTELTIDLAVQPLLDGKTVGYWTPTYKDVNKVWDDLKFTLSPIIKSKDEQLKQIKLITGGKLDLWSLESPDNGRGFSYDRAIVDEAEKARHLKNAWEQTIRGTLVDREGDAWFMSTPKFGETYFKEVLFKNEEKLSDWKSWRFTSFDNPHLNSQEIDEARTLLDDVTFRCEYMAEDVDVSIRPFAYQWDEKKHVSDEPIYDWKKQLIISVDFNLIPFCVTFRHYWNDSKGAHYHIFDEAEIKQGSIPEMIDRIRNIYMVSLPTAILTGDAMGNRGDISQRDNASLYIQLLRGLGMRESQLRVHGNPTHENSRANVNYILCHFPDYKVHSKCKGLRRDFNNVQVDAFGSIVKSNRNDLNQRADYLDTERYSCHNVLDEWRERHQRQNRYI